MDRPTSGPTMTVVVLFSLLSVLPPPVEAAPVYGDPGRTRCALPTSRVHPEQNTGFEPGFYSVETVPVRAQAYNAAEWSDAVYVDLTDVEAIPANAVIKTVQISYGQSAGGFSLPHLAIFNDDGRCFYVNRLSRRTDALAGQPVRQRWRVQFWTEAIWSGPARLWPRVTITYEY